MAYNEQLGPDQDNGVSALVNVLFVCLGNICRSPMAEAVFRRKVREAGLEERIAVDSAGTSGWHAGEPPHYGTRKVLERHGIGYEGIVSRKVNRQDFQRFQYIVAMDSDNLEALRAMAEGSPAGRNEARLVRFLELLPDCGLTDVPDPYYTGNFDQVYDLIDRGCDALLAWIVQHEGLKREDGGSARES